MVYLDDVKFPNEVASVIISQFEIDELNLQDMKDLIYFASNLSAQEAKDLIDELFYQIKV